MENNEKTNKDADTNTNTNNSSSFEVLTGIIFTVIVIIVMAVASHFMG